VCEGVVGGFLFGLGDEFDSGVDDTFADVDADLGGELHDDVGWSYVGFVHGVGG
jgi:hypothetical protein